MKLTGAFCGGLGESCDEFYTGGRSKRRPDEGKCNSKSDSKCRSLTPTGSGFGMTAF